MSDSQFAKTLDEHHHFPEMVMLKVIGPNTPEFVAAITLVIQAGLHLKFEPRKTLRVTPNKKHVAVTFEAIAGTAVDLAETYEKLCKVEGAVMVL
jgi:putative lipoic acid-binding regulatory protein